MKNNKKSILFLSALDFKEKSIQVIRKTPEAYVKAGWNVNYIVIRDNSIYDNYYYEDEISLEGVNIIRNYLPLQNIISKIGSNRILRRILQKIAYSMAVIKLFLLANQFLKRSDIDILYGYEVHGVLAVNILKILGKVNNIKTISRFQGTFYSYYYYNNLYSKIFANLDHYLALYLPSDLCIMTDDGTQGNKALEILKSKNLKKYKFWVNGVDEQKLDENEVQKLKIDLNKDNKLIFLTVCRLEHWKRVDRAMQVVSLLSSKYNFTNFKFYIVGEGVEKNNLIQLSKELNIERNVVFTGAIENTRVKEYLNIADFFLSTYDLSNVGNPLLEAIRSNKIIFTLNNGDTSKWIKHKKNGFIYSIDNNLYESMAKDMIDIINDSETRKYIYNQVKKTEKNKLWTWEERLSAEIKEIENLL